MDRKNERPRKSRIWTTRSIIKYKKGLKQNQRSWISKTTKSSWTFHITWKDRKLYGKNGRIQIKKDILYVEVHYARNTSLSMSDSENSLNLEEMERHLKV